MAICAAHNPQSGLVGILNPGHPDSRQFDLGREFPLVQVTLISEDGDCDGISTQNEIDLFPPFGGKVLSISLAGNITPPHGRERVCLLCWDTGMK